MPKVNFSMLYTDVPIAKLADLFEQHARDNKIFENVLISNATERRNDRRRTAETLRRKLQTMMQRRQDALQTLVKKVQKIFATHSKLLADLKEASEMSSKDETDFPDKAKKVEELVGKAEKMTYCDARTLNSPRTCKDNNGTDTSREEECLCGDMMSPDAEHRGEFNSEI